MMLNHSEVKKLIQAALKEDIGRGDITTKTLIPLDLKGIATITLKEKAILCGLPLLRYFFPKPFEFRTFYKEGSLVKASSKIITIVGHYRKLLEQERVFLNFLGHLSGIATLTHQFVRACHNKKTHILETRKTTPGLRTLEKYAVKMGGGTNHRSGLFDAILIKENHLNANQNIQEAILKARKKYPHTKIEVEVKNLKEVKEAIQAHPHIILLDNMTIPQIKKAQKIIGNKALIEVSGNVSLRNIKKIGTLNIDRISIGALTHSAPCIDFSMWIEKC